MSSTPSPICRHDHAEVLQFPWGTVRFSASRTLGNSGSMTFGRATMHPGHQPTRHRHPNCDEVLHVLAGNIEHSLGDEYFELGPGDTIVIPAGIWHDARVVGDTPAEMTISFSSADRQTEFAAATQAN
jgi:quercetin dioxygenase-like cupin family protein